MFGVTEEGKQKQLTLLMFLKVTNNNYLRCVHKILYLALLSIVDNAIVLNVAKIYSN